MRTLTLPALFAVALAFTGCGKGQSPAPEVIVKTKDAQGSDSDQERFQGVWRLVKPTDKGNWQLAEDNNTRFQFVGDIMSRRESQTASGESFTVSWQPEKNPKLLTLVPIGPDGKPQPGDTQRWIYKFDGDLLAIAYGSALTPPTDFHPNSETEVVVLRLKKTGEQPVTPPAKTTHPESGM